MNQECSGWGHRTSFSEDGREGWDWGQGTVLSCFLLDTFVQSSTSLIVGEHWCPEFVLHCVVYKHLSFVGISLR